eukprot:XP_016661933.1 PREDICTED: uncharacterized protein LOC100571491 isoform X2 [Acyrthosiphon pisum]
MSDLVRVLETHKIKCHLGLDREGIRGGFIVGSEYVWFTKGADIVLYSKTTGCVESSRSFIGDAQTGNSIEVTFVRELHKSDETMNMLLVGCSCKSFGILFVCQLPTLTIIRCIHIPSPISYISTINNESLAHNQLCDKFKVMSTVLLVGMITGAVYAVDLRKCHIENQLRNNEIIVNESSPSKLFIIRKNEDCQEVKEMSDDSDCHLAMFINEKFCNFYKRQCSGKLNFNISCLLYTEEINAVAIGYITGHFQLWDCKNMQTLYVLKKPECNMPITHITFLEQADVPNNLCYLWIIQSDNSRLPNAMMIALSYEHRIMMANGRCSYRVYKEYNIKLKMILRRESGIGQCISALTLCNDTLDRKSIGLSLNCGITLFAMLIEIRQNVDSSPKSYIFLFDINQWIKAQMPSIINHIKVSNSYACFVKLPDYASYLDFNISNKTLRPFGSNFRNNFKIFHYPSSIYFECECLLDTKIIRFKHVGVQQKVLDKLILNSWSLFENPSLIFRQCSQTNLRPLFWDKTYDYQNYTLLDKLHFVVSIIVENNFMSVFDECVKKWKNGTHSEVIILQLVECLWNHVMFVKQYADQLCIPLFDSSGVLFGKKNVRMLNECLSQMQSVENIFKRMQFTDCVQIINVDLVNRVKILNLVTQYFNAIIYFLNLQMLPKQIEEDPIPQIIQCDFTSLIQYANKRRMEFGNLPLYLIDAIVTNEPNGNKLIEQWKLECIEETKGLYPPTSVQSLLRIYLNAELSNIVKDFITIYFLIDVCSVQKMNEITANIFNDTFVKNEELYKLCCASWFFDHDLFEDAMLILASINEWMVNDKSWNWYHWTVLKLFVFKKQYYWAQIYLEIFEIKLVNLDDHKFYVNLQIMNNHCFDALCHLNSRKIEEKMILFEYIFDRCRHTNQLKTFLSYPLDPDEKKLFFSCLKKFEDTKLIQLMFLVQEKRYPEALELCKSLKVNTNSKHDYIFAIASVIVGKINDNICSNNKSDLNKKIFSNEEIKMTFMNCFMDNHINMSESNTLRSYGELCQINLIIPDDDIVDKIQGLGEKVSTINGVLSTSKIETVKQIENKLLKLLDTPFIQNISTLPSVTSVAVPRESSTDNMLLSTIKLDKTFQTLTFGLPDNNDSKVEKFSHKEGMSMKNIIPENVNVRNSDTNNLLINMVTEQSPTTFHKLLKDNSKIKLLETSPIPYTVDKEEYEKMDISDNDPSVLPDGEYKYYFEELDVLLGGENYEHVKKTDIILDDSEQPDDLLDDDISTENHLDETSILPDCENEDNLEEPDIKLDDANYYNRLEHSDVILKGDIGENLEESEFILDKGKSVENDSDQLSVAPDVEDEDNLEEPYVILERENYEYVEEPYITLGDSNYTKNSEQPDNIFDGDISVENHLDETSILPDCENEDNLEEPDIILDDANYYYHRLEHSDVILKGDIGENLEESEFILDKGKSVENDSDQLSVAPDVEDEDNLEEPYVILERENYEYVEEPYITLGDSNYTKNSEQPDNIFDDVISVENHSDQPSVLPEADVIFQGEIDANLEKTDDLLDYDVSVENHSDKTSILPDIENEDSLKESDVILDNSNDTNNLEQPKDSHNENVSVENHSDQLSVIPDGENKDNLKELDVIHKGENYEYDVEPDIILDDSNYTKNSEQPDDLQDEDVNVENHSDQLSIEPEGENEDHLEEADIIFEVKNKENSEEDYAREQNIIKSFETLKSEKTPENNVMVDPDNVICPTESQSNMLKNLTPYIYDRTEENCSNNGNQIIIIEKENYLGNIVYGNQNSVVIKEDNIAEVVENTDSYNKPSTPINFQIIENPKEDLCNDQNEDYLYDKYQFSNNYISSELSTIEFNPIPEYGFNHVTMTGNESNQLEMYETNQPTSVLLNESFFNNISLGTTGDVIETRDTAVDNNIEIVIDKKSENVEPSSSNTTINTNLYSKEIKSYQLAESKDISFQQVDTNIFNSAKREYSVKIQKSCPSAASEPSKTLIIKEFPTNSMLCKDILIQEQTSKLVNFIKSSSGIEGGKNSAENIHNLSTDKKDEQPFIEQKIKNIPNLRKRRYGTKCIPCSDTKLTTKSRSESKTKAVELKIISSNISSPIPDIFEDSLVGVSKKRPKCQKKVALMKRRRLCPKYVASKYKASNSNIGLEQISGESTTNKDKNIKKIEELLPNNLLNKDTESLEELTKLAMPIKIKLEAENNNKILNQNVISCTKNFKHNFFLEPKLILKKFDVSLYKNSFKLLAMDNNTSHVSLSTNKTNSQKPSALKRLRKGCFKSMKEPTATKKIINLEELKEDSINIDKNKAITKKSKLNSYKIKKVELDKNLKNSSNRCVVASSMPDPIYCLNKTHNSLIEETINLISDDEFVSDKVQEEMGKISSDKEKLDWRIISHEVKTNTDAIPKIRIGRNKSDKNTVCAGKHFNAVKGSSKIVLEQELGLIKKSSESKKLKFNQQVYRRSSRKILKKQKCSCCTNKLMDDVCSSNVL